MEVVKNLIEKAKNLRDQTKHYVEESSNYYFKLIVGPPSRLTAVPKKVISKNEYYLGKAPHLDEFVINYDPAVPSMDVHYSHDAMGSRYIEFRGPDAEYQPDLEKADPSDISFSQLERIATRLINNGFAKGFTNAVKRTDGLPEYMLKAAKTLEDVAENYRSVPISE